MLPLRKSPTTILVYLMLKEVHKLERLKESQDTLAFPMLIRCQVDSLMLDTLVLLNMLVLLNILMLLSTAILVLLTTAVPILMLLTTAVLILTSIQNTIICWVHVHLEKVGINMVQVQLITVYLAQVIILHVMDAMLSTIARHTEHTFLHIFHIQLTLTNSPDIH